MVEGSDALRHNTELDAASKELRCNDPYGQDLNKVLIRSSEKFEVPLCSDNVLSIVNDLFEAVANLSPFDIFAGVKGNGFCVFSESYK